MKKGDLLIAIVSGLAAVTMAAPVTAVGQLRVKWTFNTSAVFPGMTFGAGHQSPFTVWDIDGDGLNEIIWGTRRGNSRREWCIKAKAPSSISSQSLGHLLPDLSNGRLGWIYPPITQDPLPGDPICQPSLVDVNNDGRYEICIAGRGGRLHVINPDGTTLWTWDNPVAGGTMVGAPQAYDVNGDGFVEFFMNDNAGYIHCVSHDGKLLWTSFKCGKANEGHPTISDIDRDGHYEVTWACQDFNLYCMDAETGTEKWRFNTGANMENNANIVIDVNEDGEYEALCWTWGQVYAVSCLGKEVWRLDLPRVSNIRLRDPVGDVDGDGSLDIAIMSEDALYLYDIGGAAPVKRWEINLTKWSAEGRFGGAKAVATAWSSYHLIADINGDGKQEILWLVPFPMVTDAQGNLLAYYYNSNVQDGARAENGGWWGDVDRDGISEWIVELNGKSHPQTGVYCLTMDGKFPADSWWPEYTHSAYPAAYQAEQTWLEVKGAYSNSLWFPMDESLWSAFLFSWGILSLALGRRRHPDLPGARSSKITEP